MDDTARVNQAFADLHDGLQLVKNVRSRVCDEPYLDMAINRLQKAQDMLARVGLSDD